MKAVANWEILPIFKIKENRFLFPTRPGFILSPLIRRRRIFFFQKANTELPALFDVKLPLHSKAQVGVNFQGGC
jgi:hypothetical protein